jgi:alpha-glucosidase (family GH31 glycosyl hydrolase)
MAKITIPTVFSSQANPASVVTGPHVRFTVLTPRMVRMEYSHNHVFEDRASQAFWHRNQPTPEFTVRQAPETIEVETEHLQLRYLIIGAGFSATTLSVRVKDTGVTWNYGDYDNLNLRGTARTLDEADGEVRLEQGLLSRAGWSVVDDTETLVFNEAGWLARRPPASARQYRDLYFFGYGLDYPGCLEEFGRVAGRTPLLPRFALGNWWSRFWNYRQDELRDLMLEFREHEIPLSVCIIDMDWHITKTGNESSGWTGYTWNREQWPDPPDFIAWLHSQGLRTALNLHPADGIWPHEERYADMSRHIGQDPAKGEPVRFDLANPRFVEGYFKILHHPMEDEGVDFWWLDWQQGQRMIHSAEPVAEVMDPLWWLNHLHFYNLGRDGTKRPFVFSRWGGLGSHRYPIGFSGDTVVSWASLEFQLYFTATASNVAFGWWSHDVGGHMGGVEEPELYARWVQWGAFSPILRLHSTKNPFHDRRPWGNGAEASAVARDAMQLRHALIPYIYSMAWRMTQKTIPLVTPMYYRHPQHEEAYWCRNQFYFGSELMVAPFVAPRHPETNLSRHTVWLPEGDWFDFRTGEHFTGGQTLAVYGGLEDIPVFAKAGGIVPLGPRVGWGGIDNPEELTVHIFPGADGEFSLYEDDGNSTTYLQGDYALTHMAQSWSGSRLAFRIDRVAGNANHVPAGRSYRLMLHGVRRPGSVRLAVNGVAEQVEEGYNEAAESLALPLLALGAQDELELQVEVSGESLLSKRDRRVETCRALLSAFKMNTHAKGVISEMLPVLVQQPRALESFGGALDLVSDAQMMALRNVLARQ